MKIPRIMLAAPASGSGKTTITCGIMEALKQKNKKVAACKCGPDYIDPMFHREVLGIPSENLDLFFCRKKVLKELFMRHAASADITVVEGVMGYYDGLSLDSDTASSYDVAANLDIPVILIVPCRGMALSIVPQILGMLEFKRDSQIRGILLNRISGMLYPRMKKMIEEELAKKGCLIPVIGYVPEQEVFSLESRHLGLVMPEEIDNLRQRLYRAGELLTATIDFDMLLKIAENAPEMEGHFPGEAKENCREDTDLFRCREDSDISGGRETDFDISDQTNPERVKVAVARDEAFCFYYQDNLDLLEELGCDLLFFSPMHDEKVPEDARGMILGGGYPELYAKRLSENRTMCDSVKKKIRNGLPCIAECGGFLYLHEMLESKEGHIYPMAGVIPGKAFRTEKLGRFGYIHLYAESDGIFLKKKEELRGHEFHYWNSTANGTDCLAVKPQGKRSWKCVHMERALFAGFPHIHFYSNPVFAERFVQACKKSAEGETAL